MREFFNFSFILLSIIFQSSSGLLGKYAALSTNGASLVVIITNGFYILSLVCLLLQAIVWQQALVHYSLSFAYPFMSLVNFIVLFASEILFHEGITLTNIIGLFLISTGIVVVSHRTREVV